MSLLHRGCDKCPGSPVVYPRDVLLEDPAPARLRKARDASGWLRHGALSVVNIAEANTRYPVSFAPVESRLLVLRVECGRGKLDPRAVYTLESVDADDGIGVIVDLARHYRNDTAHGADVELGRLRTEDIPR